MRQKEVNIYEVKSTQDNCKKFDDKYFCIRSPIDGIELEQTKNYEDKIYWGRT